ncbi:MAG: isoprenylcysteine carboxylmethyltransferase family protein [Planctomycetia bacterium]|nr:isoprenylcysteine carboxylmethyltransferase family protein [Planctomycetia bacterium]
MNIDTSHPAVLPCIVGFFVLLREGSLLITKFTQMNTVKRADRSTLSSIWITILLSLFVASPFPFLREQMETLAFPLSRNGVIAVFGVLIAGISLRWWAIHCLGRFFTVNVAVHSNHKVINTGPYMLLRHPSYTGLLLEFLALALAYQNLISLMIIMVPSTYIMLRRIRHEERVLKRALGEPYRVYLKKTYSLLPFVY